MSEYMLPEGKVLLVAMLLNGKNEASISDLCEMANAPMFEVSLGVDALRNARINVDRSINRVTLADEWSL